MKHACRKMLALLLAVVMVVGILPSVLAAGNFTDVKDDSWYAAAVKFVYEADLMHGTSATTFAPAKPITRAESAMLLYNFEKTPEVTEKASFTDLTKSWYQDCIAWAEDEGYVDGIGGGKFAPDRNITREEFFTLLWRYLGSPAPGKEDLTAGFPDAEKISSYAKDALNWMLGKNLISGDGKNLNPKGYAKRCEIAQLMMNCAKTLHYYHDGECVFCREKLAEEDEIVIYYTNDVHTYIDETLSYDSIAHLKQQTASVAAGVLLLDAGDHIQGTAFGGEDKGESIIKMMNAAKYDAATLGNHEFDYGMERCLTIIENEAEYPYLSCNFYKTDTMKSVLEPYQIFEVGGKKIAVVGITTPESITKSTPAYFMDSEGHYIYGIDGGDDGTELYNVVQKTVDKAKDAGAQYIIALGHLGNDISSQPWTSEEVIANTTGLDAFIDGHSHSTVAMKEVKDKNGQTVVLTQTGSYFDAIGRMSITAEGIKTELITEYMQTDSAVKEIKDKCITTVNEKLGVIIGHADVTLNNYAGDGSRLVRKQETNTGDFAADALYHLFKNKGMNVDCAIMNGGGVRNKAITGDLSYLSCKDIHTFGNVACLIQVTGQQILDALEWGAKDTPDAECGGFLQVSNIAYEIHTYLPSAVKKDDKGVWIGGPDTLEEYRVKNVRIGGEPLDLTKTYNLAGYNYTLRDMGDGFNMFKGAVNVLDYVAEDYMVLADYIKTFPVSEETGLPTITAENSLYGNVNGSGRIVLVTEAPTPE